MTSFKGLPIVVAFIRLHATLLSWSVAAVEVSKLIFFVGVALSTIFCC